MVDQSCRNIETVKFSEEAVDDSWIYLSKWAGMPIHCRPSVKIPYVLDGEVHYQTSFIEGLPALDNLPDPLLKLYIDVFEKECRQKAEAAGKANAKGLNQNLSDEEVERQFEELKKRKRK